MRFINTTYLLLGYKNWLDAVQVAMLPAWYSDTSLFLKRDIKVNCVALTLK